LESLSNDGVKPGVMPDLICGVLKLQSILLVFN